MLRECPDGHDGPLVFDPSINVCVFPSTYHCNVFACHRYNNPTTCRDSPNNCSICCDDFGGNTPRCGTYENLFQAGCRAFEQTQYDDDSGIERSDCVVLAPGERRNITVTFTLKKHPLDLYYLMDTTGSMADDKVNLVALSSSFVATVSNLTDDFHIGFGTFKDKPMFPSNPDE